MTERKLTPATFELRAIARRIEHEKRVSGEHVPAAYVEELLRAAEASEAASEKLLAIVQTLLDAWESCVLCGAPATRERDEEGIFCDGCAPSNTWDRPGAMAVRAAQLAVKR